jgi:NADH-quinone oxidoreductase subunit F
VDLRLSAAQPSPAEREAIDAVVGLPVTPDPVRGTRHLLLPALHAVQARAGWISPGALRHICDRLGVPPAEAYGVASFYMMFSTRERPPVVAHVCDDIACRVAGGQDLCAAMEQRFGPSGSVSAGGKATWMRSPCLGQCDRAPAALIVGAGERLIEHTLAPARAEDIGAGIAAAIRGDAPSSGGSSVGRIATKLPQSGDPKLRLLRRVGRVDPGSLDDYRAHGGYAALRRALEIGPDMVIRELIESKLAGRGGAAFPTGKKWDAVARASVRPRYVVCNADESEPGTFKDRVLMEEDPFTLIEAMAIAGLTTGCERGYIYVRGEYPLAAGRLSSAIEQARARGLLGDGIMGRFSFDIEMRRGAGAYICGEETALFNSIEGKRGEPRNKPPFPTQQGLFGKPTLVNNVETLANVPAIVMEGGAAFASVGTAESTGSRLFCLSGHAARPGIYEVPLGTTLGDLLDLAGGVAGGRKLQAILLGGAAGTFVGKDSLGLRLTFEDTRAAGASLGSGVVMVFDDTVDLEGIVARIAEFFREESCGQCVPCRVGTIRQKEAIGRLAQRRPLGSREQELKLLADLAQVMRDASICGLGQTAASAVSSAIARFGLFDGGSRR